MRTSTSEPHALSVAVGGTPSKEGRVLATRAEACTALQLFERFKGVMKKKEKKKKEKKKKEKKKKEKKRKKK